MPISSSNLITCPLRALKRYADLGEIVFDFDLPLFRGINGPNAKVKLRRSKLSYSRVRELVKEAFKDCIDSTLIAFIVSEQEVQVQQPTTEFLTDYLETWSMAFRKGLGRIRKGRSEGTFISDKKPWNLNLTK